MVADLLESLAAPAPPDEAIPALVLQSPCLAKVHRLELALLVALKKVAEGGVAAHSRRGGGESLYFAARQTFDDARHLEAFCRRLDARRGQPRLPTSCRTMRPCVTSPALHRPGRTGCPSRGARSSTSHSRAWPRPSTPSPRATGSRSIRSCRSGWLWWRTRRKCTCGVRPSSCAEAAPRKSVTPLYAAWLARPPRSSTTRFGRESAALCRVSAPRPGSTATTLPTSSSRTADSCFASPRTSKSPSFTPAVPNRSRERWRRQVCSLRAAPSPLGERPG